MNALESPFRFTITDGGRSITLRGGDHVRMYPTGNNKGFGELLSKRQIDLLRIATAVHVADGWALRHRPTNGHRSPALDVEVLDAAYWASPDTLSRLKTCVDFLSGGDDWSFQFRPSSGSRHDRRHDLFRGIAPPPIVPLYSGGLDSATGLAARLATAPGRMFVPVTLRHQMRKGKLVRDHFKMLINSGLTAQADLQPFEAGAFIRNGRIKREVRTQLRGVTHRCRPMLFMAVAGVVADTVAAGEVEVYESGVGSVNLPLVSGPADFRTTRSTHPHFLRLMSALVSHVSEASVRYVLPFADRTKAEMVSRCRELGLEELARSSISCIIDPRRRGGRQCGHCPACVYRRQAMLTAGIRESRDAYAVDLFSSPEAHVDLPASYLGPIRAFHQQVGRLAELDADRVPRFFRAYLYATRAVATDAELSPDVEVYRRYRREWEPLIADARRGLPWVAPARALASAGGASP